VTRIAMQFSSSALRHAQTAWYFLSPEKRARARNARPMKRNPSSHSGDFEFVPAARNRFARTKKY
jgi:hypothetical protein